jgi:uncharacterized protein YndB with AHSA1/START domain
MTGATHSTFVIERTYPAAPERVWAAWSEPGLKARWHQGPDDWTRGEHELDFRVGGCERSRVTPPAGPVSTFLARYLDILPGARIIYSYDMCLGDARISVSLATVELAPAGAGTRLTYTEQGAYRLDGEGDDPAQREHGVRELLDRLGALVT